MDTYKARMLTAKNDKWNKKLSRKVQRQTPVGRKQYRKARFRNASGRNNEFADIDWCEMFPEDWVGQKIWLY